MKALVHLAVEVEQVAATRVNCNTEVLGHSHAPQETHALHDRICQQTLRRLASYPSSERERLQMSRYPPMVLHSPIEPFHFLPETRSDRGRNGDEVHLV